MDNIIVSCFRCKVKCAVNVIDKTNQIYCKECYCMKTHFIDELENPEVLNEIKKEQIERNSQISMKILNKDLLLSRSEPIHINDTFRKMATNVNKNLRRKTVPVELESSSLIYEDNKILSTSIDKKSTLLINFSSDEGLHKIIQKTHKLK